MKNLWKNILNGEELTIPEIKTAIRKATLAVEFYPVVCGTAFKNKGVQLVLDAVIDYLPSPIDIPPMKGTNPDTEEEVERHADDNAPFSALAFQSHDGSLCRETYILPCVFRYT